MKLNLQAFGGRKVPTKLEKECGVTEKSLNNALLLLTNLGKPTSVTLVEEPQEWYVDTHWESLEYGHQDSNHRFSGFSWGYGGEGPHGLMTFLTALGLENVSEQVVSGVFKDATIFKAANGSKLITLKL